MQAFHADVKEEWSLFMGEWFTLKYVMGYGVVFRRDGIPLNSSAASESLIEQWVNLSSVHFAH